MGKAIHNAIPFIARSIAKKMSTKVVFDSTHAHTDNESIFLPNLPLEDHKTEVLGIGYTIHEAAHIRFSDFTITEEPKTALQKALWAIIEDVRIEMETIKEYPGAKHRLCQLADELIDVRFFKPVDEKSSPGTVLQAFVLYQYRADLLSQKSFLPMAQTAYKRLETQMPEGCLTRTLALLGLIKNLTSEREAFDLAKKIVEVIEEESKKEPPKPPQQEQKPNEEKKDGSEPKDADKGDQQPSQQGDEPSPPTKDKAGKGNNATPDMNVEGLNEMLAMKPEDQVKDIGDGVGELLEKAVDNAVDQGASLIPGDGRANLPPLPLGDNATVLNSARESAAALRTKLYALLQATKRAKRSTSRRGRKLNGRKIVRIKQNNPNVFKSTSRKKGINTTVQILLDRSGSMDSSMELASQSCLALASALDSMTELSVAAAAFPGRSKDVEPMTLMNETVASTAARYPAILASGGTPLLPALMWATHQLLEQKQERKVLLIITDGTPSRKADCEDMIERLNNSGIEVMGLGIRTQSIKDLVPNSRCIDSVDSLASSMFDMFKEKLI